MLYATLTQNRGKGVVDWTKGGFRGKLGSMV